MLSILLSCSGGKEVINNVPKEVILSVESDTNSSDYSSTRFDIYDNKIAIFEGYFTVGRKKQIVREYKISKVLSIDKSETVKFREFVKDIANWDNVQYSPKEKDGVKFYISESKVLYFRYFENGKIIEKIVQNHLPSESIIYLSSLQELTKSETLNSWTAGATSGE